MAMDNQFLQELVELAQARGGGFLLNVSNQPAAVVLSIERYNQLLNSSDGQTAVAEKSMAKTKSVKNVLVTGGAGYIGAHLVRQLLLNGCEVTVLDNLSAGRREHVPPQADFIEGDLSDMNLLRDIFAAGKYDAVFHMAASIEVEESVSHPEKYFENNVVNTEKLLLAMHEAGVKNLVFSSSAAVYGEQAVVPIAENAALSPNNPYGATKYLGEKLIEYFCDYAGLRAVIFRYFNACGCDFDGQIRLTHHTHLIPIVMEVAAGQKLQLLVNGNDYSTTDGTCVRDYVHVLDIARAHVLALDHLSQGPVCRIYNIGTGQGLSVKQIVNGAAEILNKIIPMEIGPRRPGDAPATVADNKKIAKDFRFIPEHSDLNTIITTSWQQFTNGFKK